MKQLIKNFLKEIESGDFGCNNAKSQIESAINKLVQGATRTLQAQQIDALKNVDKVAILDVDGTLYPGADSGEFNPDKVNQALLTFLTQLGYNKVILFTSMKGASEPRLFMDALFDEKNIGNIPSRERLRQYLQEEHKMDVIAIETSGCPGVVPTAAIMPEGEAKESAGVARETSCLGLGYEVLIQLSVQAQIKQYQEEGDLIKRKWALLQQVCLSLYDKAVAFSEPALESSGEGHQQGVGEKDAMAVHVADFLKRYCTGLKLLVYADDKARVLDSATKTFKDLTVPVKMILPTKDSYPHCDTTLQYDFGSILKRCIGYEYLNDLIMYYRTRSANASN